MPENTTMGGSTDIMTGFVQSLRALSSSSAIDGVVGDGSTDDTLPLQAALDRGGLIVLPPRTVRITSALKITASGTRLIGAGASSTLLVRTENTSAIRFSGTRLSDVQLAGFAISSEATTPVTPAGLIHCDGPAVEDVVIEDLTFEAPQHGMNAVFFKSRPNAQVSRLTLQRCTVRGCGRMGFEIIQHEAQNETFGGDVRIYENVIKDTGRLRYGMGVSLSGGLAGLEVSRNTFEGNAYCGIELAGPLDAVVVSANIFRGEAGDLLIASNRGPLTHLAVVNNVSSRGTRGKVQLKNSLAAVVTGNNLTCSQLEIMADDCIITGNNIEASAPVALMLNNASRSTVANNRLSTSLAAQNHAVLRAFGRAAGNVARHNVLVRGPGGEFHDQISGASGNFFSDNQLR